MNSLKDIKKLLIKLFTRSVIARKSIEIARRWPSYGTYYFMRILNNIQISTKQLTVISKIVREKSPCNFLIFGLGNDSVFWLKLNAGGETIFLEDNDEWYQEIVKKLQEIKVYLVTYSTRRGD